MDAEGTDALHAAVVVHHESVLRNKRCLMAYQHARTQRLMALRHALGPVLPTDVTEALSRAEREFVGGHSKLLRQYAKATGVDLATHRTPPAEAFIDVYGALPPRFAALLGGKRARLAGMSPLKILQSEMARGRMRRWRLARRAPLLVVLPVVLAGAVLRGEDGAGTLGALGTALSAIAAAAVLLRLGCVVADALPHSFLPDAWFADGGLEAQGKAAFARAAWRAKLLPAIALNAAWLCAVGASLADANTPSGDFDEIYGAPGAADATPVPPEVVLQLLPPQLLGVIVMLLSAAAGGPLTIFGILLYRARKAPDLAATAVARWGLVEGERTAAGALKLTGLGAVAFPLAGGLHLFQFGSGASALDARRPPLQPLIQVVGALLFANAILNAMAGGLLKRRKLIVQG